MSRIFGELNQVCWVVPDIEAYIRYWGERLGVGPWSLTRHVPKNAERPWRPRSDPARWVAACSHASPATRSFAAFSSLWNRQVGSGNGQPSLSEFLDTNLTGVAGERTRPIDHTADPAAPRKHSVAFEQVPRDG